MVYVFWREVVFMKNDIYWKKENVFKILVLEKIILEFIVSYNLYKFVSYDNDYVVNLC